MGMLAESEYDCPECDGEKEAGCPACGQDIPCDYCDETGWDPEQVDVPAFKAASKVLQDLSGFTQEWIDRTTNTRLGRDGGKFGRVAVADFLI